MKLRIKVVISVTAIVFGIAPLGCKTEVAEGNLDRCHSKSTLLENFITADGQEVFIFEDGTLYINMNGSCTFSLQYFDPDFIKNNYVIADSGTFIITDSGELFPTKNDFVEDFESYDTFQDMFAMSVADTHLYWNSFILQSPSAPEVSDYVELRKCILSKTCNFIDNKIELARDPTNAFNQVLKFSSVPPTAQMITSKASIESGVNYFVKGTEVWFQADYYIESGMPFSLVDFENSYFYQSPGPRVVIRNNQLNIENKFGAIINYSQLAGVTIPQNQWFTVKVHYQYSNQDDGIIELWQDGNLLISEHGINLPTSNSIQNNLEVGITATSVGCVLFLDNMRISETAF